MANFNFIERNYHYKNLSLYMAGAYGIAHRSINANPHDSRGEEHKHSRSSQIDMRLGGLGLGQEVFLASFDEVVEDVFVQPQTGQHNYRFRTSVCPFVSMKFDPDSGENAFIRADILLREPQLLTERAAESVQFLAAVEIGEIPEVERLGPIRTIEALKKLAIL